MNTDTISPKKVHHGHNVKRLREMLGVKQEAIAFELDMTQQNMSLLEQKEEIEDKILIKIAKVLQVPVDALKNMSDEATLNYINTFNDHSNGNFNNYNCTFNPVEKIVQLYEQKIELYERMLKAEQEKVAKLEELVKGKK